jgi:Beige/BEACH domain
MAAERFSLLLLDDGEVLLDDVACDYQFIPSSSSSIPPVQPLSAIFLAHARSLQRGHVKIGSRNLFFDGDDWRDPVVRVPIAAISAVCDPTMPSRSNSASSVDGSTANPHNKMPDVVLPRVESEVLVTMRRLRRRRAPSMLRSPGAVAATGGTSHPGHRSHLSVIASRVLFQREHGVDHPYVEADLAGTHVFTPLYSDAASLHELVVWLHSVAAIPSRRDRERAISRSVCAREANVPFDIAWLENGLVERTLLDEPCAAVYALSKAPGRVRITSSNIYLMPIHGSTCGSMRRIAISLVVSVRRMRHGIRDAAFEIGYNEDGENVAVTTLEPSSNCKTLMLSFQEQSVRDVAVNSLIKQAVPRKLDMYNRLGLNTAMTKWRCGEMSNFDYLMYLNLASGRSFNDLSQYPVFPWVVSDFTSPSLDLSSPTTFRDLSLPIGAINPMRLANYRERYREMPPPRFFYGTHYSTPAYVINYLVRAAPAAMIRLQNGRFDTPDRLFHSLADTWRGVSTAPADMKELTPEFFAVTSGEIPQGVMQANSTPGEFLDNLLGLDLGVRQDGKRVEDVELPPWAESNSRLFVTRHREALESVHVSRHIHYWIDLIFGYKARNADACNLFYTDVVSRDVLVDADAAGTLDEDSALQLETVLLEFGRTPDQLFSHPHPHRFDSLAAKSTLEELRGADLKRENSVEVDQNAFKNKREESESAQDDFTRSTASTVSTMLHALPERPLSIKLLPSCAFMSQLPKDSRGCAVLSDASPPKLACSDPAFVVDLGVSQFESDVSVATAWSDGYLRVFVNAELRRSRFMEQQLTACACGDDGLVFLGIGFGSIAVYNIGSGRSNVALTCAHDAPITALCYSGGSKTLVSSSSDAMIRVWTTKPEMHGLVSLQRQHELDAEDSVINLTLDVERPQVYIAALTIEGSVIAWCLTLGTEDSRDEITAYPTPIVRLVLSNIPSLRTELSSNTHGLAVPVEMRHLTRRICWIGGPSQQRMLAVAMRLASGDDVVQLWSTDTPTRLAVEILAPVSPDGDDVTASASPICVAGGGQHGTLLVGSQGWISEFDCTGLCLQQARIGRGSGDDGSATILSIVEECSTLVARLGFEYVVTWSIRR